MMLDFLEKCSDPTYAYIHDTFDTYEMTRTKVRLRVNEVEKIKEDREIYVRKYLIVRICVKLQTFKHLYELF